jgi:predicted DNA-binding protein
MFNTCLASDSNSNSNKNWRSLAKEPGRRKSYYAREAIRQYLKDRAGYLKGIAALERREPTITLAELERRLGLDD